MSRQKSIILFLLGSCALVIGYLSIGVGFSGRAVDSFQKPSHGFQSQLFEASTGQHPCSTEQIFYHNGRMTGKLVFWNNQPWERTLFEYLDELSLYSVQTMVYHGQKVSVIRKDLFHSSAAGAQPDQKIESWYYYFDKDRTNSLRQVDTYWPNTNLVRERQVFDEFGGLKVAAIFEYDAGAANHEPDENQEITTVKRMTVINDNGEIVSDYRESTDVDLRQLYTDSEFTDQEIERRIRVSKDASRIPVLVMDGGIDIHHTDLAYKLWRNLNESSNGVDDDGNGLVDDVFGVSDNPRVGHPIQELRLPRYGLPAFSHGTLVASIASRGREDVAIMSASELTTINSSEILPQVERLIESHGVRFTIMSFIFDKQLLAWDTSAERPYQLNQLIQNTPQTLHVVAAGNGAAINGIGFNVDKYRQKGALVPVMLPHDNMLVVGALNTDRLNLQDYASYELADFSNVGELSVDILAPGTRLCGAQMGGGTICQDGTSFAAPYVLNHGVLNVARVNPDLTIYQIKEILMKTAYIPDLDYPFPVRSGGILHPRRAVAAARWLAEHPTQSVEAAVLAVRRADPQPIPGESNDLAYMEALQSFWTLRQMRTNHQWYAQIEHPSNEAPAMP